MRLSNKKVSIIVFLMIIALSGLVVLQAILLNSALKSEEETFQRSINLALSNVIKDLTSHEARTAILKIAFDDSTINGTQKITRKSKIFTDTLSDSILIFHNITNSIIQNSDSVIKYIEVSSDEETTNMQRGFADNSFQNIELAMIIDDSVLTHGNGIEDFKISIDTLRWGINQDSSRMWLIQTALTQLEQMEQVPIVERVDTLTLDSAIAESFKRMNINLDYSFAVINKRLDSIILSRRNPDLVVLAKSPFKTLLFPSDLLLPSNYLVVDFPDKQTYIYSKLLSLIIPTVLFLLLILSCFIYSIRLILTQRKTSIRLTDFINNMTHEFKTPISTIQLASEALAKDDVLSDKNAMLKFNKMIFSENNRMKNHVDKILQIATLEQGDYILTQENINMHSLITDVVESFSILLKQRNGIISLHLIADKYEIKGDKVHILNIVYNLLDNALKYSKDNPQISVTTDTKDSQLLITIKDHGIGIHPDDMKFLFKKYYRVSSGNLHDTKGFGLGLSYVKMMVEAHKGSVVIHSALEKGTEVVVTLPPTD